MSLILEGLSKGIKLLLSADPEIVEVTVLTLKVTGFATLIAIGIGVPLGLFLAFSTFKLRSFAVGAMNTGMGLPPTVVGLWVSLILWRSGPLGFMGLMYTPAAIVIAQSLIATPIVTGFTMATVQSVGPKLRQQIIALGASPSQYWYLILKECRFGIMAAIMAGLGRIVAEVGASMSVGGNVRHYTRMLTTSIVMEIGKGNFDVALALSVILMTISYGLTLLLTIMQQKRRQL